MKETLWSNMPGTLNYRQTQLMTIGLSETEALDEAAIENNWGLDCLQEYASDVSCGKILCYGSIGRWNGPAYGCKILNSLEEVFQTECNYAEWYVEDENLYFTGIHHDGTDKLYFREVNCSDEELDKLCEDIYYSGSKTVDIIHEINKKTLPLAPVLKEANIISEVAA